MSDPKQTETDVEQLARDARTKAKEAVRAADGTSWTDRIANAGDEVRNKARDVGEDARNAMDEVDDDDAETERRAGVRASRAADR
jgi:hypothetical protein